MSRLQIANFPPYALSLCHHHLERQNLFQGAAKTPPPNTSLQSSHFMCLFPFGLCFSGVFAVIGLVFVLYRPLEDFQTPNLTHELAQTLLLP